jgi:transcription elongation factor Elf1
MKLLENIREVFKTLKHRQPSQIYCPRCCSSKISLHSSLDYGLMPKKYVCANCGYMGPVVMELEKEKETESA